MNGAEFLLKCLEEEGVTEVFGYPGGAVIPLFDAVYENENIKVYRPAHEQGGTHAADGYARATGKPGVMISTSGPGVTNCITGIASAMSDSVPLVVIAGQVGSALMGKSSFQEVDTVGITMPIVKHNYLVTDPEDIGETIADAFYTATEGRPGPVVIDITKNALEAEVKDTTYTKIDPTPDMRLDDEYADQYLEAVELLKGAKKPVIYAGGGVLKAGASEELRELAEKYQIPVANSIMGLGSFDRTSDLSFGIVGMHGDKETNMLVYESDVLLGVGVRFSDRAIGHREGFTDHAKIIHLDTDPTEFNKNVDTSVAVAGDIKEMLGRLIDDLEGVDYEKRYFDHKRSADKHRGFLPLDALRILQDHMPEDTIVSTDVGQHQMWTVRNWKFKYPNTLMTSGGLGTMGFGLGAAIGAKVGRPDRPVLLVTGDGSFRMNHLEYVMAKSYDIPITTIIFNNRTLGMVRQWQSIFNEGRYSDTDISDGLDYEYLAKAYGINFLGEVDTRTELKDIMKNIDLDENNLIVLNIDIDEPVSPMVAAGSSINNVMEFYDRLSPMRY